MSENTTVIIIKKKNRMSLQTPSKLADLWVSSWQRQCQAIRQILTMRYGPIQMERMAGEEVLITMNRRYRSITLRTRLGDTLRWIWDFQRRHPEGTTVADLRNIADLSQWLDNEPGDNDSESEVEVTIEQQNS